MVKTKIQIATIDNDYNPTGVEMFLNNEKHSNIITIIIKDKSFLVRLSELKKAVKMFSQAARG